MTNLDLKLALENEAERLLDLASKLSDKGKPLNKGERSMIRRALIGLLEEMQWEQYVAFLRGDEDGLTDANEHIIRLLAPSLIS